jgi:hypothetical protein
MTKRKTHQEFLEELKVAGNGEYTVLQEYQSSNKKIMFKHLVCGCEWELAPSHFFTSNVRCPRVEIEKK